MPTTSTHARPAAHSDTDDSRTTTKKHMVELIAEQTKVKRATVKLVVQALLEQMTEQLAAGKRIEFRDHLILDTKHRAARVAQNPKTLKPVTVPEKRTVRFKAGRLMRDRIENVDMERASSADAAFEPAPARNGTLVHAEVKPLPERALR